MEGILQRYLKYTEKYSDLYISDAMEMTTARPSRQIPKYCGYLFSSLWLRLS